MRFALFLMAVAALPAQPLELSISRAVEIATSPEGNTSIQLAGESLKQAQAQSVEARSALLPDFEGQLRYESETAFLGAYGIRVNIPIPGYVFPSFVGPFSVLDTRLTGNQAIVDFSSIRRFEASRTGVSAAKADVEATSEQVAARVARAYLAGIKADADVETAEANVALSEANLKLAENQKNAGIGTGIEVTRARVQLSNDRQQLLVAQNNRRNTHLELLRSMNMRLDVELSLSDKLSYKPVDTTTLEHAKTLAAERRPDYRAQLKREENAQLSASATRMERLPSLQAFGDYGPIGSGFASMVPTRTYGISLKVPIFDGGRRDARRVEADSQYRAERVRTYDLKEQIDLDVRVALDDLSSAEDQVKVAREGLDLAESELAQARRRYAAGVAINLEVTDAQTRLERARDNQTTALYNHSLARIELAQAMGNVRQAIQ